MTFLDARSYRPDEILSAADVNAFIANTMSRLDQRPAARVSNIDPEGQEVGTNTWATLNHSGAKFNNDLWDGGDALVLPEEGLYLFGINWALFPVTSGIRLGRVILNDRYQVVRSGAWIPSGIRFRGLCWGTWYGFPGDAFTSQIYQTSGEGLAVLNEEDYSSFFWGVQLTAGRDVETWTAPSTWGASEVPSAAKLMEQIRNNIRFLRSPPAGRITRLSGNQNLANNTNVALTHALPIIDSTSPKMFSSGAPTSLTIQRTGIYLIGGSCHIAADVTGHRGLRILRSGSATGAEYFGLPGNAGHGGRLNVASLETLSAGHVLELEAFQNSGGTINHVPHPQHAPVLWAVQMSENTAPPATVTGQKLWVPGETLTATDLNTYLRDHLLFLLRQPAVRATKTANQPINSNVWTAMTFPAEVFDNDDLHSTASNTSRITFSRPGLYIIGCTVRFASHATGSRREVRIVLNAPGDPGTEGGLAYDHQIPGGTVAQPNLCTIQRFTAGDFIEVYARQNSGGALNVESARTTFWAVRVSA